MFNNYGDINDRKYWDETSKKASNESDFLEGEFDNLVGVVTKITEKEASSKFMVIVRVEYGPQKGKIKAAFYSYKPGENLFFTRQLFLACGLYTIEVDPVTGKEHQKVTPFNFAALKGHKFVFDTKIKGEHTNLVAPRPYDPNVIYDFEAPEINKQADEEAPFDF